MLWALEALRIFDDRLSDSLDKVKDAKEKMLKYISQVSVKSVLKGSANKPRDRDEETSNWNISARS